MKLLIVLLCILVFVLVFKPLIKKHAIIFYVLALFLDVFFVVDQWVSLPKWLSDFVFICIQKCTLSLAIFIIVMYIGIFRKGSKPRTYLMPIRKELSIMACFLALGHMTIYVSSYASRMLGNFASLDLNIAVSLIISLLLFILLLTLGVTSFDLVKKHMSTKNWKRVQKLSYLFFMLVYLHVLLFLLPSAFQGGQAAQISVVIYSAIFIFYAGARIIAALCFQNKTEEDLSVSKDVA